MNTLETNLRSLLRNNIVAFTFKKVDGTIRHALGTRNLDLASRFTQTEIPTPKGEQQPTSYFDLEKMGWRSWKEGSVISVDGCRIGWRAAEPTKKGELPKRDIPVVKPTDGGDLRKPDINAIISGLFGGTGAPIGGIRESWDKLDKDIDIVPPTAPTKVGIPTPTEKGIALPLGSISVEDFAKMVARYVVDEIVNRLK